LLSRRTEAYAMLSDAVGATRDQDVTWTEIGQLRGLTAETAARPCQPRNTGPIVSITLLRNTSDGRRVRKRQSGYVTS